MEKIFLTAFLFYLSQNISYSQCCGAGSGSPIAGGVSQGVLLQKQFEVSLNYQYISTKKFLNGDSPDENFLDRYYSNYEYLRVGYGVTKDLTMSVETGYWINKTQIGLEGRDTILSHGIGDLILFPRYDIYHKTGLMANTEITIGMGWKIPLGDYSDSTQYIEPFSGNTYSVRKPPTIQLSTGSNDFIFYGFFFRGYPMRNFRIFSNILYIRKGWNPVGEKPGDYFSMSLFASKTVFEKLALMLQVKGEYIAKMKVNQDLNQYGFFNYDTEATGSKKILLIPQIGYTVKDFSFYVLTEIPLYQYVNKTQIASQYQFTTGISYRINKLSMKQADKTIP